MSFREAQDALEEYKKKDPVKGTYPTPPFLFSFILNATHILARLPNTLDCSGRAIQGCGQCAHHEAELLQDHGSQPIPGRHPVSQKGAGLESGRSTREYLQLCVSHGVAMTDDTVSAIFLVHIYQPRVLACAR